MDIMPTILELAGTQHPAKSCVGREMATYRDRKVFRMTGKSWVEYLSSPTNRLSEQGIYGDETWIGWELHGHASLRKGRWKIVWLDKGTPTSKDRWELFDPEKDPGEVNDLGERYPEKLQELLPLFDE